MKIGVLPVCYIEKRIHRINKKRIKSFTGLDDYPHLFDVPYIDDGELNHKFDIYWAKENRNNICVIDIHGGAYIFGQHRDNYPFARVFLEKGFDFIAVDYVPNKDGRSTKSSLDDCYTCIKYILERKEEIFLPFSISDGS